MHNQIRIIAGKWRRRKINFPATKALRPTPDRVRETLFNWLSPYIPGARCLDLFAGSGALSFEALSRGASSVVAIEKDPAAIAALHANSELLKAEKLEIIQADSLGWMQSLKKVPNVYFDIIFADPPYSEKLLPNIFSLIKKEGLLKPGGLIYFESDEQVTMDLISNHFKIIKEKKAGNVYYGLCTAP